MKKCVMGLVLAGWLCGVAVAAERPNVVFVFTDDQRWDAMGVVQEEMGERGRFPWLKTPNLDRMAAEGMRFRNAFVINSVCSPARACLLTGQYNHFNGVANNLTHFPVDADSVPKRMQQAGYVTGMFGKWHMKDQKGKRPGFDVSKSYIGHGRFTDCFFEINGVREKTSGWVDDVTTDYAIDFIQENKDRPFLAWVGFKSPHGPREPAPRHAGDYRDETPLDCPNLNRFPPPHMNAAQAARGAERKPNYLMDYFRTLNGVDENVGRLLQALDEAGIAENTLLVFSSDNGYYLGEHCKTDKRLAHEESLRIPLLIRWPKVIAPGSLNDDMVLNIDLSATFVALAGADMPEGMQGRSVVPLLSGNTPTDWRTSYFYEYFHQRGAWPPMVTAVRSETHKLIEYHFRKQSFFELFDVVNDPYETRNLYYEPKSKALKNSMTVLYEQEREKAGFVFPDYAHKPERTWPDEL